MRCTRGVLLRARNYTSHKDGWLNVRYADKSIYAGPTYLLIRPFLGDEYEDFPNQASKQSEFGGHKEPPGCECLNSTLGGWIGRYL